MKFALLIFSFWDFVYSIFIEFKNIQVVGCLFNKDFDIFLSRIIKRVFEGKFLFKLFLEKPVNVYDC